MKKLKELQNFFNNSSFNTLKVFEDGYWYLKTDENGELEYEVTYLSEYNDEEIIADWDNNKCAKEFYFSTVGQIEIDECNMVEEWCDDIDFEEKDNASYFFTKKEIALIEKFKLAEGFNIDKGTKEFILTCQIEKGNDEFER